MSDLAPRSATAACSVSRSWFVALRRNPIVRDALLGVPAIIGLVAVGVGTVLAVFRTEKPLTRAYSAEGARQLQARHYEAARVCYQRLLVFDGRNVDYRFGMARAEIGIGRAPRAHSILRELAPADRPGHAPAQFETARQLLARASDAAARGKAKQHVAQGLRARPEDPDGNALMAQIALIDGRVQEAEPFLARAAAARPEWLIAWASSLKALARHDEARRTAESAWEYFSTKVEALPNDMTFRLRAAEAATILDEYAKAVDVLRRGLELSGDPRYRSALAKVHFAWADHLSSDKEETTNLEARLDRFVRGLVFDPKDASLAERFKSAFRFEGPDSERHRAMLRRLLVRGNAGAGVHFALALEARKQGHLRQARLHLEQAFRLSPALRSVGENPAWGSWGAPKELVQAK